MTTELLTYYLIRLLLVDGPEMVYNIISQWKNKNEPTLEEFEALKVQMEAYSPDKIFKGRKK